MLRVALPRIGTVPAWRTAVRDLVARGVPPADVVWQLGDGATDLFAGEVLTPGPGAALRLPREAIFTLESALCHRDPERFARAHDVVARLARGALRWGDRSDPALYRVLTWAKTVRRDIHKMHAFVRFREVGDPGAPRRAFAAWFEPEHRIVEAASSFFAKRFGDMDWIIATPDLTARFEGGALSFAVTESRTPPPADESEALWLTYFANIFNPARLMVSAMTSEMPQKYWKNLPEAALIPDLIREAPARARAMQEAPPTLPPEHVARIRSRAAAAAPAAPTLATLKLALDACRRCPIGACATQGVPGEGPAMAELMIVGEQPGDAEDLAGRPFVGPAGQVFDRAAGAAGLDRSRVYVTNAVKHFKYQPRGKRRLHQRPTPGEVTACKWWLDLERREVRPRLIVAMGATAALSLTGSGARLTERRGGIETAEDGAPVLITLHPSYILRLPDAAARAQAEADLTADLARAWKELRRILSEPISRQAR